MNGSYEKYVLRALSYPGLLICCCWNNYFSPRYFDVFFEKNCPIHGDLEKYLESLRIHVTTI